MRSISLKNCLALTASIVVPAVCVHAQPASAVAVGARVRVTAPAALTPHRQVGSVLALRGDTLVLQLRPGGDSVALPMAQLSALELSRGRHSSTLKGFGYGMVIGTGTGILAGAAWGEKGSKGEAMGMAGLFFGFTGLVAGGLWGTLYQSERWERTPLGVAGRVSIVPHTGGVTLSLAGRF